MSINDFFNEPKFKRFQKFLGDKNTEELYNYLENEGTVKRMIESTKLNKPALAGIIKELEEIYIPKFKIDKNDSLKKQLIGSMISFILAEYGYKNNDIARTLGKYNFFTVAACYDYVKYNPFNKEKKIKSIYKLGTSEDFLYADEFDDYIGNNQNKMTFKKIFQLLIKESTINNIIQNIENNSPPIDYVYELISKFWPELPSHSGSSGYIFELRQGQIVIEAIIEHILKSRGYINRGYTKSKYFPKALKYYKSNDHKIENFSELNPLHDDSCYFCKQKIEINKPYLKIYMFIDEKQINHENIRFCYPKICANCSKNINHFNNFFKNINIEQLKNDSQFLLDLPTNSMTSNSLDEYFGNPELQEQIIEQEKEIEELKKRINELENKKRRKQ